MWEPTLPDAADNLRQGDLLQLQPMPRRGGMTIDETSLASTVKVRHALVIEQCCTVENRHTLMLAKVDRLRRPSEDNRFMMALRGADPAPGKLYAYNEHLLDDLDDRLPFAENKVWAAFLLDRLSFAAKIEEGSLQDFQVRRVARMTVPARALLRTKLALMLGRPEKEDAAWLIDNNLDERGLPAT